MQYRINGKTIPKFAVGTWAWGVGVNGSRMVFGTSADEAEIEKAFNTAYQKGFILWDTAAVYGMGNAEKILGKYVKNKSIFLSDKYTPKKKFNTEEIKQTLNQSIERVGIIPDIYWLHLPMNIEENLTYMCSLLNEGKIGSIGVSNFSLEQIKKAEKILEGYGFKLAGVQNHYSLIFRKYETENMLSYCKEKGIPFFSYMVLEQGALTGRFNSKNGFPIFSRRGMAFPKSKLKKLESLFETLKQIGEKYDLTIAETALAWAASKGTIPIVGITKEYQAAALAKLNDIILTQNEIDTLEKSAKSTGIEVKASWE